MVTYLIYDLLPVWLGRLAELAKQSLIYRLIAAVYHWAERLVRGSLCCRLWQGFEKLRRAADECLFFRMVDAVTEWMTAFAGKMAGWAVAPVLNSATVRTLHRIPHFSFAWVPGVIIAFIFLVPGEAWRNQYALLLSFALFALSLLDCWNSERTPFRARDLGLGFFLFVFAAAIAIFTGASVSEGIRVFCFFLTSFLLCVSMVMVITNTERLMTVLGFVYVTLVLTGTVAFVQRIIGVEVSASLTDLTMNAGMPGRVYSTLENPNNYAEFIVLTFPLSLVFCMNLKDRRWQTLAFCGLVLPIGALLMTYSRSSWVSFALAAVVFLALWNKRLLPLVVVAAVIAVPILPDSIFNRILTIGNTADSSNAYRLYIWTSALNMIRDYGLIGIGLGPGNFTPVYAYYCDPTAAVAQHSHMLYMEVWLEMGILGLVGFLAMYLGTIRKGIRTANRAQSPVRLTIIACVSSLVGMAFVCAAEYVWFYPRVMFAFFLLLGITLAALKLAKSE